jgi:hypothetical protein
MVQHAAVNKNFTNFMEAPLKDFSFKGATDFFISLSSKK